MANDKTKKLLTVCAYCQSAVDAAGDPHSALRSAILKGHWAKDQRSHTVCNVCLPIQREHLRKYKEAAARMKALGRK